MKISLDWLRTMVDLPETPAEVAAALTRIGFPVEGSESTGPGASGFVVGTIIEAGKHPNADKLTLCRVDVGTPTPLQIVCGAPNAAVGLRGAVALVGATLPGGTTLKKAKLRGVESEGMLLSERELGLSEDHTGIIDLGPTAPPPGTPLHEVLGSGDTRFDIDIPSNRGDGFSHLGLARELAALHGRPFRHPAGAAAESGGATADRIRLRIEDTAGSPRYLARIIEGVKVGPSPPWLVRRLRSIGQRSINNVVDVTNFILWEMGQPLHAFDADRIDGTTIVVRRARAGERLVTLDGVDRTLGEEVLVIADTKAPIALAGIMGGAPTQVTDATTTILLEGAFFDSFRTLRGSAAVRLVTDASLRFVRGIDPAGVEAAIDRAAKLLAEVSGGRVVAGRADETAKGILDPRTVSWRPGAATRLIGEEIPDTEAGVWLERLGYRPAAAGAGMLAFSVPSHRRDVFEECDLVEDVARFHGYEQLTDRSWNFSGLAASRSPRERLVENIREALLGFGFSEILTPVLTDPAGMAAVGIDETAMAREGIAIPDPQSREESLMRMSLLPGALRAVSHNARHGHPEVRLFEIGATYRRAAQGALADEPLQLLITASGGDFGPDETRLDPAMDGRRFRGVVEAFLTRLRVDTPQVRCYDATGFARGTSAIIESGKTAVGEFGRVDPAITALFDLRMPVHVALLSIDALESRIGGATRFREWSRFPASRRDLAFLVDRTLPERNVADRIRELGGDLVRDVTLFDRFEGGSLPAGKISLAYRLTVQADDRTLSDDEIRRLEEKIVTGLTSKFGAELRDR